MRRFHLLPALVLATLAVVGADTRARAAAEIDATSLLEQIRGAMGGASLTNLRSLSLAGTYRRVFGEREMSGDLEVAFEFPDRFLRTETMGFGDPTNPVRRFSGFAGSSVIERTAGGGGMVMIRAGAPNANAEQREALLMRVQARDFARLVIALLATSPEAFPVEFAYAGEAESPDGRAHVLDAIGADGFAVRLFVDQATSLPLMLSYRDVAPRVVTMGGPGGPRPAAPPNAEQIERRIRERQAEGPPPVAEFQLYLSEYRSVNGVMLPHRIQRAMNGEVNEEWEITKAQINPSFPADKFATK